MEKKSIEQRSRLLINAVIIEENTAKLLRSIEYALDKLRLLEVYVIFYL